MPDAPWLSWRCSKCSRCLARHQGDLAPGGVVLLRCKRCGSIESWLSGDVRQRGPAPVPVAPDSSTDKGQYDVDSNE
jgi:hypothetical protein